MVAVFGQVKKQKAPRAAGETAELWQSGRWSRWRCGPRRSRRSSWPLFRRTARTVSLEGLYSLAVLKGKAHTLAEDMVVNTDTIRVGHLVVKAQWLRLEQRECEGKLRSYMLLAAETLIIVNHMVRLAGLRFSPGPGGPADRQLRSAREARLKGSPGHFRGANPARPLEPQVRPRCGLGHQKGPRGVQSEP